MNNSNAIQLFMFSHNRIVRFEKMNTLAMN